MIIDGWIWAAFAAVVAAMFLFDLLVFGRKPHEVSMREAGAWSFAWLAAGVAFTGVIWAWQGSTRAGEYLAGYLIERSLSIDNIFVFALIFGYFAVPTAYRHRVLFWGILGALVLRVALIFAGAAMIDRFHWVMYVFGAFLVVTGIKMAMHRNTEIHPEHNPVLRLLRRWVPIADRYDGHKLLTARNGKRMATPLLAVFVVVATTDVIFAVDSIPAIFAVTTEPFIVLSANVFALLGLRALYFLLEGMMNRFAYLQIGLAAVLIFVGAKMLLADIYHIPIWASLLVIGATLAIAILASLARSVPDEDLPDEELALDQPPAVEPRRFSRIEHSAKERSRK